MSAEPWITLQSDLVFDHKWYKVRRDTVRLPDGAILDDYFVSVRPEIVIVFAVTVGGEVPFVRQYRQGVREMTLELPGGTFDTETGDTETGEDAAARELLEETGYRCGGMELLSTVFADASKNSNQIHTYLGSGAELVAEQHLDETESASGGVDVVMVPLGELRARIRSGEIKNESTVLAIYRALEQLGL
jgi:8-oxo-dGTP pyrophosphatase MutT (NUDIX family)